MPDRVVIWRALADFSTVRSESAKTQASLAALQKQVDQTNTSNTALGTTATATAAKVESSNSKLAESIGKVEQAKAKLTQATNAGEKAYNAEQAASAKSAVAAAQAQKAKMAEASATTLVANAVAKLAAAKQKAIDTSNKQAIAEQAYAQALAKGSDNVKAIEAAENKLTTARARAEKAVRDEEAASQALQKAQLKQAATIAQNEFNEAKYAASLQRTAAIQEQALQRRIAANDKLRQSIERVAAAQRAASEAGSDLGPLDLTAPSTTSAKQAIADTSAKGDLSNKQTTIANALTRAEDALAAARARETSALTSLNVNEQKLAAARANQESATQAVTSAEQQLARVMADGNASDLERANAEGRLLRSKQDLLDANNKFSIASRAVAASTNSVAEAQASVQSTTDRLAKSVADVDREFQSAGGGGNFFTRALTSLIGKFDEGESAGKQFGSALSLLKLPAIGAGLYYLVAAVSALVSGLFELASAVGPAIGGLAAIGPAVVGIGTAYATVKSAMSGVGTALKAYTAQQKAQTAQSANMASTEIARAEAVKNAQEALVNAQQQVGVTAQQGADSVASAAHTIVTSQQAQLTAQQSLNQARKNALDNIQQLKQAVVDAALAERGATLNLQQAKENLQKTLNDPTSTRLQREQAQLAVDNAENQLKVAKKTTADSKKASDEANKAGVEGAQNVVQAKQQLADATYNAADAEHKYTEAVQAAARQNQQAIQAVAKAQQALADAQRKDTAAGTQATYQYQTALKMLGPAARGFVEYLISIRKQWQGLKEAAGEGLFPGLEKALNNFLKLEPTVKSALKDMGYTLGGIAVKFSDIATESENMKDINKLFQSGNTIVKNLGDAASRLFDALIKVFTAAIPMADGFTKSIDNAAKHFQTFADSTEGQNKMAKFFAKSTRTLHEIGDIIKNVITGLFNMGKAANPAGQSILDSIDKMSAHWAAWTKSVAGQKYLRKFFDDVRQNLKIIDHILGEVGKGFFKIGSSPSLGPVLKSLEQLGKALVGLFSGSGAGKVIAQTISNIADAIKSMTGNTGGLTAFFSVLSPITKALAWFVAVPGVAKAIGLIAAALLGFKAINLAGSILQLDKLGRGLLSFGKAAKTAREDGAGLGGQAIAGIGGTQVTKEGYKKGGPNALGKLTNKLKARKARRAGASSTEEEALAEEETLAGGAPVGGRHRARPTPGALSRPQPGPGRPRPTPGVVQRSASGSILLTERGQSINLNTGEVTDAQGNVLSQMDDLTQNLVGGTEENLGRHRARPMPGTGEPAGPAPKRSLWSRIKGRLPSGDEGFLDLSGFGRGGAASEEETVARRSGGGLKSRLSGLLGMFGGGGAGEEGGGGRLRGFMGGAGGMALGAGLAVGGEALGSLIDNHKGGVRSGIAGGLEGASQGAMFGMMFGPEGALVGALVGGLIGVFTKTKLGKIIADWWKKDAWPEIKKLPKQILGLLEDAGNFLAKWGKKVIDWIAWPFQQAWKLVKEAFDEWWKIQVAAFNVVKTVIMTVFNTVKDVVTAVWSAIWDALKAAWDVFWAGLKKAWDLVVTVVTWYFNTYKTIITTAWKIIWDVLTTVWNVFWNGLQKAWNGAVTIVETLWNAITTPIKNVWNGLWSAIMTAWDAVWGALKKAWDSVKTVASETWSAIADGISGAFNGVAGALGAVWKGIEKAFTTPINWVIGYVIDPFIDAINAVITKFGLDKIGKPGKIGVGSGGGSVPAPTASGHRLNFAEGGTVPKDVGSTIPGYTPGYDPHEFVSNTGYRIHLSGGEGILVPEATRALGGKQGIDEINRRYSSRLGSSGGPAYADGGVYRGEPQKFWLGGWVPNPIPVIVGGAKDVGKAAVAVGKGTAHLAEKGYSELAGLAGSAWHKLREVGAWASKKALQAAEAPLRALINKLPVKFFRDLTNGMFDKVNNAVYDFIAGKNAKGNGSFSGKANVGGSGELAIWKNLLAVGMTPAQAAGVMGNMQSESGFDPNVIQGGGQSMDPAAAGAGGYGLVQWTPGRKLIPYLDGQPPTIVSEIQALAQQLSGKGSSPEGAAGQALRKAKDPSDAATIFGLQYERYAGGLQWARAAQAQNIYNQYKDIKKKDGGLVQFLHSGGVVGKMPSIGPRGTDTYDMATIATQANIAEYNSNSSWTSWLINAAKARLRGVNLTTGVAAGAPDPQAHAPSAYKRYVEPLINWMKRAKPRSYNALWEQEPVYKPSGMPNGAHRMPLFPLLAYASDPSAFVEHYKDIRTTTRSSGGNETYRVRSGDTLGEIARKYHTSVHNLQEWNKGRYHSLAGNPNLVYPGWDLVVGRHGGSSRTSTRRVAAGPWPAGYNPQPFLAKELQNQKARIAHYRRTLGLSGAGTEGGLWSPDMNTPNDHIMAHALGISHPADWPHPWSGPVSDIENQIAESDRANELNNEWYTALQTLAGWGFTYLVDSLQSQGISSGLTLAKEAAANKAQASALNDSLKAGKQGFAGLSTTDQGTILGAIGKIAGGTATKPFGLRDVSSYLNVPDYAVVNLFDKMTDALAKIPDELTAKFKNDVALFREGLFYANTGRIVPGTGDRDTVPAMLTPGEGVLNKAAMARLGQSNFNRLNNGEVPQFFANGGIVLSPKISNPAVYTGAVASSRALANNVSGRGNEPKVVNINTEINNPVGENSVYSMNKSLQRKSALGIFN